MTWLPAMLIFQQADRGAGLSFSTLTLAATSPDASFVTARYRPCVEQSATRTPGDQMNSLQSAELKVADREGAGAYELCCLILSVQCLMKGVFGWCLAI